MKSAFGCLVRLAIVGVSMSVSIVPAEAQTSSAVKSTKAFVPPKTAWGEPDLQGLYTNKTITPFERPAQFANAAELTDEQIAELEQRAAVRSVDNGRPRARKATSRMRTTSSGGIAARR